MRQNTLGLAIPLLAFASCASAPLPEALLPYEDAARFLLPGFRTVALSTHEFEDPAPNGQMFFRRAFCGSDFERPGGVGIGSYRGIEVMDFGPAGLGGARPDAAPAASFAGVDVFHTHSRHRDGNVVDEWFAWVDDRFSVSSHHRELLERSLARGAELTTLLQPFAALSDLPGDATGAVGLLARPEDQTYWGRPVPIETTVVALFRECRLVFVHREPLPAEFLAFADRDSSPATTRRGEWSWTELRCRQVPPMLVAQALSGLVIWL